MDPKFYIDYPQEKIQQGVNAYRCSICKNTALAINGLLDKHKIDCTYRIEKEKQLDINE